MRKTIWLLFTLVVLIVLATVLSRGQAPAGQGRGAQPAAEPPPAGRGAPPAPVPVFKLEDNFLQWRLLPSEKQYEAIDGKHLMETVRAYFTTWYQDIITEVPRVEGGYIYGLPGPGLGTRLLPDLLERPGVQVKRSAL